LIGPGTRQAFRRRGIDSAMHPARKRIARRLGYRDAVRFAGQMGCSP
jgi:hypothetical protein